ncbi:phosphonate ABC transporter substrate-binding protein [Pseudoroseomonas rhizosphaerae]|uniref:Phosphonate ABC transporter substrate-binding protein n=1 Tax=Teichococcus rhizosphaerae TaxID=1335062 RepID=A0A2C7AAE4_9PROT|nr:phosphonate ABC transporter substrate-binding protein [Pseudoroseomonas rhizosphaerae]
MAPACPAGRRAVLAAVALAGPRRARATSLAPVRFGLTPVFLESDLALLRALSSHMAAALGTPVELVKRRTYQEVVTLLLTGQLDAAWICGFPYVRHADRLSVLAVPVHRGRPLYQSYLIADPSLRARSLADLRGRSHAFSDPDSNSGCLTTRWLLAGQDLSPATFFGTTFFAYGHRNVVRAVSSGLAESGSVDGYVWETMAETEPGLTSTTDVVARSAWQGFPPVCCLTASRQGAAARGIEATLLGMAASPAGTEILRALRLDGFMPERPILYDGIRAMSQDLESRA